MLELRDISFSYDNKPFIEGLSLGIGSGEFVSVLGANGSGKSTLISIMSGTVRPYAGSVIYGGRQLAGTPPRERARNIACVFQHTDCSFPFTCYETAEMGLYPHKRKPDENDIKEILDIMDMTDTLRFKDKPVNEISGGELQRVLLARALVQKPGLLLLDEAMSGMDISVRLKMSALLKRIVSERAMSVVFVRHDIENAFSDSDRIIAMKNGAVLYDDRPARLMREEFFVDIFNVKAVIENGRFRIIDIN